LPARGTELLSVTGLSVSYSSGNTHPVAALEDVDLRVERGEFVALIGPSGCGKSTLLKAVSGLLPQHLVRGEVCREADLSLGFLFQRDTLLPWRTVLNNVAVSLEARGVSKTERLQRARAWLDRLGLQDKEKSYPRELSGGQRQRVLLARTLIYAPELVLLDEPLGSLDSLARVKLQEVLLGLHRDSDQAFILVTHDLDEALAVADRVVVLGGQPGSIRRIYPVRWRKSSSVLNARMATGYADLQRRLWLDLGVEANGHALGVS